MQIQLPEIQIHLQVRIEIDLSRVAKLQPATSAVAFDPVEPAVAESLLKDAFAVPAPAFIFPVPGLDTNSELDVDQVS